MHNSGRHHHSSTASGSGTVLCFSCLLTLFHSPRPIRLTATGKQVDAEVAISFVPTSVLTSAPRCRFARPERDRLVFMQSQSDQDIRKAVGREENRTPVRKFFHIVVYAVYSNPVCSTTLFQADGCLQRTFTTTLVVRPQRILAISSLFWCEMAIKPQVSQALQKILRLILR